MMIRAINNGNFLLHQPGMVFSGPITRGNLHTERPRNQSTPLLDRIQDDGDLFSMTNPSMASAVIVDYF